MRRDQIQHVEMARDIGQRFNHLFGKGKDLFVLPEAVIEEEVATLPGLDGRKMSHATDTALQYRTQRCADDVDGYSGRIDA